MIRVTCALIRDEEERVLVVQRGAKSDHPFKWEFPGGKIQEGETDEECIIREIAEELSMGIVILTRMQDVEYDYGSKHILLIPFICDTLDELPLLSEHIAFRWVTPREFSGIDFSEADVIVAREYLKRTEQDDRKTESDNTVSHDETDEKELRSLIINIMGRQEAEWIANSALENPVIFRKLIDYSYSDDSKLAFHASWILSKVCDREPGIIYPFLNGIIGRIASLKNESAQRSFLRIISMSEMKSLDERAHGVLAEYCFTSLRSGFSAIAIKAYSMEILYKLAKIYPDLIPELSSSISIMQGEGSAGIIARGRIILRKLAGITSAD